jgi:hypothetical protein
MFLLSLIYSILNLVVIICGLIGLVFGREEDPRFEGDKLIYRSCVPG